MTDNVICSDSDMLYVEVKESTIKNAGNGVFAKRRFERGEILCEYRGVVLSAPLGVRNDTDRDLVVECKQYGHRILRATDCVAGMINDCVDIRPYTKEETREFCMLGKLQITPNCSYNCTFLGIGTKSFVVSIREIEEGEELFVEYGRQYWGGRLYDKGYFTWPKWVQKGRPNKGN